jgi:hypothetical protein
MTSDFGKRLAVIAFLLAAGGCELLKHVRITSEDPSPFSAENGVGQAERTGIRVRIHLPPFAVNVKEVE